MILHLSEITKGKLQDVVQDYTLNLKYSNYFAVNAVYVQFFCFIKKGIFVDLSSSVTVCKKGMNNEVGIVNLWKKGVFINILWRLNKGCCRLKCCLCGNNICSIFTSLPHGNTHACRAAISRRNITVNKSWSSDTNISHVCVSQSGILPSTIIAHVSCAETSTETSNNYFRLCFWFG